MKALLLTTSVVALFTLIIVSNNAAPVTADPPVPSGAALTQLSYEIEKIKLEIEMLECDRVFTVRPDHVIQKELESANARLKLITELPK
jgi:hypothetical protein